MEFIAGFVEIVLHLDKHLAVLVANYGTFTYAFLFLIIFMETGFVVTPFLPGDSLLFATGAIASLGSLNLPLLLILLSIAAILGDTVNYWAGRKVGTAIFRKETGIFLNKKHLERTHRFYEKHGGKTIIIARFIPIVRTFAPFVAGIGDMSYPKFLSYNIIGGLVWINLFTLAGYYFGNIPVVKHNFSFVIFVIIGLSVLPIVVEFVRKRREAVKEVFP
ncbi:MAG: DedA family protein [Candidatus Blackburnbacteria bacterium]|nr:DedA family protein [Candidatus Blackburnbacteria bacterium]